MKARRHLKRKRTRREALELYVLQLVSRRQKKAEAYLNSIQQQNFEIMDDLGAIFSTVSKTANRVESMRLEQRKAIEDKYITPATTG